MKAQKVTAAEVLYVSCRYNIDLSWDKIGLISWHFKNKYFESEDIQARIDQFMQTHANETLEIKKQIGRRSLLRKRENNGKT
jgi:hypothetical protein